MIILTDQGQALIGEVESGGVVASLVGSEGFLVEIVESLQDVRFGIFEVVRVFDLGLGESVAAILGVHLAEF